ncbi:MAG: type II toxin-antitoxin system RelB/DinJ family antitoxin [Treponemataceae bacterium]|nr:MAG: type II toxin-antitoxin system RelB/DinJ family antitoxin [Treponemataceae bacterium]
MAQISIRIDDAVKAQGEQLFSDLGLTLSGAFNIFVRQSIRQGGIPFPVTIESDPFYNPANIKWLEESIAQMQRGEVVKKTFAELEAMAQ